MEDRIEELQKQLAQSKADLIEEKKRTSFLQSKIDSFGLQGKAKLYYSLNRNMSDIADMLDGITFKNVDLGNKDDKTMERLKLLWASVKPLAETINTLSTTIKLTGDEDTDTAPKNVLEFAEVRK